MNPHPPLAMFPPAIATLALILEIAAVRKPELINPTLRVFLAALLAVGSAAAYYSGFWGLDFAKSVPISVIKQHQGFARVAALSSIPTIVFSSLLYAVRHEQRPWVQRIFFFFLALQTALLLATSHLGGAVVFDWAGGVKTN